MKRTILILSHLVMVLVTANVYAAAQSGRVVSVPHHQSTQLMISGNAKKVTLGDPAVLDILVLKSNELYLIGKSSVLLMYRYGIAVVELLSRLTLK